MFVLLVGCGYQLLKSKRYRPAQTKVQSEQTTLLNPVISSDHGDSDKLDALWMLLQNQINPVQATLMKNNERLNKLEAILEQYRPMETNFEEQLSGLFEYTQQTDSRINDLYNQMANTADIHEMIQAEVQSSVDVYAQSAQTQQLLKHLIGKALKNDIYEKYGPEYSLLHAGASIIQRSTTASLNPLTKGPTKILDSDLTPGNCFGFQGIYY